MITPKAEFVTPASALKRSVGWIVGVLLSIVCLGYTYTLYLPGIGLSSQRPRTGELTFVLLKTLTTVAEDLLLPSMRSQWWEGNKHPGEFPRQASTIAKLASISNATLCQVGFKAGHTAALLMTSSLNSTLYVFDKIELPYSVKMLSVFSRIYYPRFHALRGSSVNSLPWFIGKYPDVLCDLVAVDNNHNEALTDFLNSIKMSKLGGILLANEITDKSPGYKKAWSQLIESGYIKDSVCEAESWANGQERTWCFGTIVKKTGALEALIVFPDRQPDFVLDRIVSK